MTLTVDTISIVAIGLVSWSSAKIATVVEAANLLLARDKFLSNLKLQHHYRRAPLSRGTAQPINHQPTKPLAGDKLSGNCADSLVVMLRWLTCGSVIMIAPLACN